MPYLIYLVLIAATVSSSQVLTDPQIGEFYRPATKAEIKKCYKQYAEEYGEYDGSGDGDDPCENLKIAAPNGDMHPAGSSYSTSEGGSSGADKLKATSTLASQGNVSYNVKNTQKNSRSVAWCEGVKGYGTGQKINMSVIARGSYGSPYISDMTVVNGYAKNQTTWQNNSRVKKLRLYVDGKSWAEFHLEDVIKPQTFNFPDSLKIWLGSRDEIPSIQTNLSLEILEVYPGSKFDDTCITGIDFYVTGMVRCFAQGTKILMSNNTSKNIETIKSGDMVKSYDFENKKMVDSKVTKLVSVKHSNLLKLKLADNEIITTDDHPFWIDKNVWAAIDADKANKNYVHKTKVETLKVGDKIFIPEKNTFSAITEIELQKGQQMTHTLELSENDNFIANSMLVKTEVVK